MMRAKIRTILMRAALLLLLINGLSVPAISSAQTTDTSAQVTATPTAASSVEVGLFSLQVTPSVIVETIKPGETRTVSLRIQNNGDKRENLKLGLSAFTVNSANSEVQITNNPPEDVIDWVKFAAPLFSVDAGAAYSELITISPPENSGFSYAFAITINRQAAAATDNNGKAALEGTVAVFNLISIDRPDAKRDMEIAEFSIGRRVYEYLPTTFTVKLRNKGNTIIRPGGNIYIQRSSNAADPLKVLRFNDSGSYLLPGVTRSLSSTWDEGFPVFVKSSDGAGDTMRLEWNWGDAQKFRFGHYVAKLVAVYNDGQRDVPVEAVIDFWVIPWKLIIGALLLVAILVVGVITIGRKAWRVSRRKKRLHESSKDEKNENDA